MGDFEKIYQEHGKTVYSFLLSLSHDEHLSEELTQETMFRAIMNFNSFRGDCKLSVWLCQIAKNLYYEWYNKGYRIDLRKIKGHAGHKWNELADQLATGAITAEEAMEKHNGK